MASALALITIRSVPRSIMLILRNLTLWLVTLISANRLCLNYATMVADSAPRHFFCAMRGLVLDEQAIGIREKIQIVVDHSRERLNHKRSVDEQFFPVQTLTHHIIHIFIEVSHLRFLLFNHSSFVS